MGRIIFKYAAGLGDSAECVCTSLITSWSSGVCIWQVSRFQFKYLPQFPRYLKCVDSIHSLNRRGITEFGFNPKMKLLLWSRPPDSISSLQTLEHDGTWWPGLDISNIEDTHPILSDYPVLCLCATQYFVTVFFRTLARAWHVAKLTFAQLSTSSCDKYCCDTDLGRVSAD